MKLAGLLFFVFSCLSIQAQVITTVGGNGSYGYTGDGGLATNAQLGDMYYTYPAFDNAGNMYFAQYGQHTIRKIDAAGIITTIAGTVGVSGYSGDGGPALNAVLSKPTAIAVDQANNIYFSDRGGEIIRKIDPAGIITTVSGQFITSCGVGNGGALALARFNAISALTFDKNDNLYIAEFGCNVVRMVNNAGIVSNFAGNNTPGFSGDGGLATQAQLYHPGKVAVDNAGNVYIPDHRNHRIRKVSTTGIISTIAGNGSLGNAGDGGPATLAQVQFPGSVVIDNAGNLYVGSGQEYIRKIDLAGTITTYCGNGVIGYTGDGGPATQASIDLIEGRISIDANDNIYFVNYNAGEAIRKVSNCLAATIAQHPVNAAICNTANTSFSVTTSNATSYAWQINTGLGWTAVTDNALYSGASTTALTLTGASNVQHNFQYRCAVTNSCGTLFSTAATLSATATVAPAVSIVASTGNSICAGVSVSFTASAINPGTAPVYQWLKNGLPVGTNSTLYTDAGINQGDVIECVLTSNANCLQTTTATSNAITMSVTANVIPTMTITASANNICYGTPITFTSVTTNGGITPTYTWIVNGTNLLLNAPSFTSSTLNEGDFVIGVLSSGLQCVTVRSAISNFIQVNINPVVTPAITITASETAVCKNTLVTFTATAVNAGTASVYQWQKNGQPVGNNSDRYTDNSLLADDRITCILEASGTCLSANRVTSNSISVIIHPDPVVLLDQDPSLCSGTSKLLDAGNFSSYLWSTGAQSRRISVTGLGMYSVTVTDNNGCTGTGSTSISNLLPAPSGFLPADTVVCTYGDLFLQPANFFSGYQWNTGAATSSLRITTAGTYWLQVKDNNGCTGTDTILVKAKDCLQDFFIPTAFTPNDDGKNDLFKPFLPATVSRYSFIIYNRWGQVVFQTTDSKKGWDGRLNGLKQDSNVFLWVCTYQLEGEKPKSRKGSFVLIR